MEVDNLFGFYKNLKNGMIYSVIGIFTHSETNEKLVAYHDSDNNNWVRPLDLFLKNGKVNEKINLH